MGRSVLRPADHALSAATGITVGTGPTTYAPNNPVTRSQLAAFLCRYSVAVAAQEQALQAAGSVCGGA